MKKGLPFLVILAILAYGLISDQGLDTVGLTTSSSSDNNATQNAFERQLSDVQVLGRGTVVKVLSDDLEGSRHQRFILKIPNGPSLLVAHNIDLAPRIDGLRKGDSVEFFGEYEWNAKGGVLHWTHDDPAGRHKDGWLKLNGRTYH